MSWTRPEKRADSARNSNDLVSLFPTDIGWMGIVGHVNVVRSVSVGYPTAAAARKALKISLGSEQATPLQEADWNPTLREELQDYAKGKPVCFSEFELQLPARTPFRDKVLSATRRLVYGQTTTYGELARLVGHPRAARAVGTVMSTNRFPILIPCHRVLAAGGKLGGYTSPAGTDLKQRLLEMEQSA